MKKCKLICSFMLLAMMVMVLCACTGNTAVNPYAASCIMIRDRLYVLESIVANDEVPNEVVNIGSVNSFWGSIPRNNGETNDLTIEEGSQIYSSEDRPAIAYIHNEYTDEYFKFICCDICAVVDDYFYVDDPRYTWKNEDDVPDGYDFLDNAKCLEDDRMPLNHLETIGLPKGTSLYKNKNPEHWQYVYVCVKENESFVYKKMSALVKLT